MVQQIFADGTETVLNLWEVTVDQAKDQSYNAEPVGKME